MYTQHQPTRQAASVLREHTHKRGEGIKRHHKATLLSPIHLGQPFLGGPFQEGGSMELNVFFFFLSFLCVSRFVADVNEYLI